MDTPKPIGAIDHHDVLARGWDDRYRQGSFQRRAAFFRDLLPLVRSGGNWLDAGCGSGYFSRMLAAEGGNVVGIDASRPMVEEARAGVVKSGLEAKVRIEHVETIEQLAFPDDSFDGCICLSVIEYLDRPFACIDEIARILKPAGSLILSIPHRYSAIRQIQRVMRARIGSRPGSALSYLDSSINAITPGALTTALAARGIRLTSISGFDPIVPRLLHRVVPPSLIYFVGHKDS